MEVSRIELSEQNRKIEFEFEPENFIFEINAIGSGHNSPKTETRLYASVKKKLMNTIIFF